MSRGFKRFVDKSVTLTGVLDGPPEFARDRLYITLCVERIDSEAITNGRVSLLARFGMQQRRKLQSVATSVWRSCHR